MDPNRKIMETLADGGRGEYCKVPWNGKSWGWGVLKNGKQPSMGVMDIL